MDARPVPEADGDEASPLASDIFAAAIARSVKNARCELARVSAMAQTLAGLLPTLAMLAARRDERHSLAELARDAGTSASTFQRAFTRIVGESPKQYTRRLQLESAALALVSTTRSVLDVAFDVGFESHEGFTRVFYPEASATVVFVIMALVLLVRPSGLFGKEK